MLNQWKSWVLNLFLSSQTALAKKQIKQMKTHPLYLSRTHTQTHTQNQEFSQRGPYLKIPKLDEQIQALLSSLLVLS